jgi:penicillin amidase
MSQSPQTPRRHRRIWGKRLLLASGILLLLVVLGLFLLSINLRRDLHTSLPQLDGTLPVAGLTTPVTVTRNAQGVPSIHASSLDDLIFAQGYITASDRLFQMDALRRHGAGELAEILGPSLLQHDRLQRYLQLRAAADRAIPTLPPDQLHQLQVYARGVNAYIAAHTQPNTLPVEFHFLHYTPAPWTPRDSLLIALVMTQDLSTEFPTKLNRESLSAHLPISLLPDLYPVGSWRDHPPTPKPPALPAPTDAPINQVPLDRTQSRNTPPSCRHQSGCPTSGFSDVGFQTAPTISPQDLTKITLALRAGVCDGCRSGSNNWVVAASRSASGAPLLSNDMHLGLTAPDIWYEAALHVDTSSSASTPTTQTQQALDVTGFTLPGVPFVIVGRNPFVAWGFTNSGADVQDLLIEHLRGHGPQTEFQHPDGTWSPAGHQTEHIHVRFGHDVTLDILTTTHAIAGRTMITPIISPLYPTERRALALAWTVYDPTTITSPMYSINTATDAASLVAAFAGFSNVSQNLVYADAHHIGYHTLGRIPIRGPATQHPRPAAPFILPDNTPPEDNDEDQSQATTPGAPGLASETWAASHQLYPPGAPHLASEMWAASHQLYPLHTHLRPAAYQPQADQQTLPPSAAPGTAQLPTLPTTPYTIGSPISSVPIDALDTSQTWSGYIPYDALPSIVDPSTGTIATANARIVPDNYPYFIANDWVDPYRVERIYALLQNRTGLTPADMLAIQTDTHSALDLLVAQRLAYALDHATLTQRDPHLRQAADLLRDWDGNMAANSPAAAIVSASRAALWPMLLAPQLRPTASADGSPRPKKLSLPEASDLIDLYSWDEKTTALEQLLQHTPARWLPRAYPTWSEFLATAVQRGLKQANAPANLSTWTYGSIHTIDIAHPIFGSTGLLRAMLGVQTGSRPQPYAGDGTTIKQAGRAFGPSERFTADLSDPEDTHANITTGESGNPSSPWYLDQFPLWLQGTTLPLPLTHPQTTHTLTLVPN